MSPGPRLQLISPSSRSVFSAARRAALAAGEAAVGGRVVDHLLELLQRAAVLDRDREVYEQLVAGVQRDQDAERHQAAGAQVEAVAQPELAEDAVHRDLADLGAELVALLGPDLVHGLRAPAREQGGGGLPAVFLGHVFLPSFVILPPADRLGRQ